MPSELRLGDLVISLAYRGLVSNGGNKYVTVLTVVITVVEVVDNRVKMTFQVIRIKNQERF